MVGNSKDVEVLMHKKQGKYNSEFITQLELNNIYSAIKSSLKISSKILILCSALP